MTNAVKNILDAIPYPVIAAIPDKQGAEVRDLQVQLMNKAFFSVPPEDAAGDLEGKRSLKNIFSAYIAPSVPILHLASLALQGKEAEASFYMPATKKWYALSLAQAIEGENQLVILTFKDITQDKQHVQDLRKLSHRDRLTHLPTRECAADALEVAKDTAAFNNTKFGLLLIDLDDIKNINDMEGVQAGDRLIKAAADVLRTHRNGNMSLFSYGSDEFLLIVPDEDTVAQVFADFKAQGIKASGGLAVYPEHSLDTAALVQYADVALSAAKRTGKDKTVRFESAMHETFVSKLTMQKRLTEAVLLCNFKQYYQPQFDIATGELRGFEALIRWQDDDGKFVPPDVFIPLAEETRLILPIGKWVLNTACAALKKWQDTYSFDGIMSINVSPVQMMQDNFLSEVAETIKKYGLSPQAIEIEVTEGVMIDNMRLAVQTLNCIKKMGMRVSLDDFGTGYSSLNYLQKLPLDTLKIDKSFINNITATDGVQAKITNSIIEMVSGMGLDTIAEGVEDKEQLLLLRKFNCNTVQGYLAGKPMTREKAEEYLAGNTAALDKLA